MDWHFNFFKFAKFLDKGDKVTSDEASRLFLIWVFENIMNLFYLYVLSLVRKKTISNFVFSKFVSNTVLAYMEKYENVNVGTRDRP